MAQASAEKLEHTRPTEKERVATERAGGKYAGAAFAKNERNRAISPEYQIMEVRESRWARAAPWRERGIRARVWRGKGGQAKRAFLEEVKGGVSGRKSSPGLSAEPWFHSKSGQT